MQMLSGAGGMSVEGDEGLALYSQDTVKVYLLQSIHSYGINREKSQKFKFHLNII